MAAPAASGTLPPNVHVSSHPCLRAKMSRFRASSTGARECKELVRDIATILGCEAFAAELQTVRRGTDTTPLGYTYETEQIGPESISLVPILRSGLGMVDAISALLPDAVPVHHLGLFREPATLQPVEYYNNLADHLDNSNSGSGGASQQRLAIVLDPILATGGTAVAAIQTLREFGARVLVLCVLASAEGLRYAAQEGGDGVHIWVGAVDDKLDERGMIVPGVGDVGDRLFRTKGK